MTDQFRKKPVVITAFQYRAGEQDGRVAGDVIAGNVRFPEDGTMLIRTLEGEMCAQSGDWIIRGVKGELYPCKPDIFAATYEPAEAVAMTFQERLAIERDQLSERTGKLDAFIGTDAFNALAPRAQQQLRDQLAAMSEYLGALLERIGDLSVQTAP